MAKNLVKAPASKIGTVVEIMHKMKPQIMAALPRHMTVERMTRVALTAVRQNADLLACTQDSLLGSIVVASQLGLEPNTPLGHAYLVPYNNRKTGRKECQLIIGYRGMVELARRSGALSTIYARLVHEADEFTVEYGLEERIVHRPCLSGPRGEITHAYAVAKLKDGGIQYEIMGRQEIDAVRQRSASSGGPWSTDYGEMARKTVIRRLFKLLPASIEMAGAGRARAVFEEGFTGSLNEEVGALAAASSPPPLAMEEPPPAEPEVADAEFEEAAEPLPAQASSSPPPPPSGPGPVEMMMEAIAIAPSPKELDALVPEISKLGKADQARVRDAWSSRRKEVQG